MRAGIYRHYKGGLYRVLCTAWESTNGRAREEVVVYVSLGRGVLNVRRRVEFAESVVLDSGEWLPRFEWVGDEVPPELWR